MSTQTGKKHCGGTQLWVAVPKRSSTYFVLVVLMLFAVLLGACITDEVPSTPAQSVTEATTESTATSVAPTTTTPSTTEPLPSLDASGGVIAYVSDVAGAPGVQIMNADGTDQRRLTDDYTMQASWSPDGQKIVFKDRGEPWTISTIDVLSGEITGVTDLDSMLSGISNPDWSPDGNSFAMTYEYDLYTMNVDGSAVTKLVQLPGNVGMFNPDWSPDGQRIAFVIDIVATADNKDIYIVDADGSNLIQLTSHEADDREPAWSPDGTKIAFESLRDGNNWDLFTMNADGSNIQNISNSADSENHPVWSPDGTRIAFESNRDGNWEIYVMNADGADIQRLTENDVKDINPEWRP